VAVALGELADRLEACKGLMPPLDLSNALFGLQGVSSDSEGVRAVLNALLIKMRESEGVYTGRDIGYSLAGLSAMQPIIHDEVVFLIVIAITFIIIIIVIKTVIIISFVSITINIIALITIATDIPHFQLIPALTYLCSNINLGARSLRRTLSQGR
jgi:hypothetical protein